MPLAVVRSGALALLLVPATSTAITNELAFRSSLIATFVTYALYNPSDASGIGADIGYSSDRDFLAAARLVTRWQIEDALYENNGYLLNVQLYFNLGQWVLIQPRGGRPDNHFVNNVFDFYASLRHHWEGYSLFAESSLGIAYFSSRQSDNKDYGTHGHFVSGWALGYALPDHNIDLLLKIQHYSNNDFGSSNPGENLVFLGIEHRFPPPGVQK